MKEEINKLEKEFIDHLVKQEDYEGLVLYRSLLTLVLERRTKIKQEKLEAENKDLREKLDRYAAESEKQKEQLRERKETVSLKDKSFDDIIKRIEDDIIENAGYTINITEEGPKIKELKERIAILEEVVAAHNKYGNKELEARVAKLEGKNGIDTDRWMAFLSNEPEIKE